MQIATITSKKQLTLPAKIFKKAGMRIGQKVIITEEDGRLLITPAERLVEELAGSVKMPKKWQGRDIDEIIEEARNEHFQNKYKHK